MLSGYIGTAWPRLASLAMCGIPVTTVIETYIEASPPCIVLLELGYIPGTVSDRKETIWRGTYRQLSPPPRLVQTRHACTCGPRAVKEYLREFNLARGLKMALPNHYLSLTMVAAVASKPTTSPV